MFTYSHKAVAVTECFCVQAGLAANAFDADCLQVTLACPWSCYARRLRSVLLSLLGSGLLCHQLKLGY